jgi:hypothetical protein
MIRRRRRKSGRPRFSPACRYWLTVIVALALSYFMLWAMVRTLTTPPAHRLPF